MEGARSTAADFTPSEVNLPGNLNAAVVVGVMPFSLCSAFQEELRLETLVNAYPDGSSDRFALAINVRHFFRMTRMVTAAQYTALWNFYHAHPTDAFYFYNLRETVPPWTWDPTGNQTVGRYLVVFDGSWSETIMMGRSQASLGLREVQ
jgi:hypothetical protein